VSSHSMLAPLRVVSLHRGVQVADECKQKGSAEAKTYSVDLSNTDDTAGFGKKLQVPPLTLPAAVHPCC
jgi:hypothetical protein